MRQVKVHDQRQAGRQARALGHSQPGICRDQHMRQRSTCMAHCQTEALHSLPLGLSSNSALPGEAAILPYKLIHNPIHPCICLCYAKLLN